MNQIAAKASSDTFNVIIEIPMHSSDPVKYEYDKKSGAILVDRFMQTAMFYPCNYGFIPHTLSSDGDPVDVLVISRCPVVPGCVMQCHPIGVLMMEDESGEDEKIIAVPTAKLDATFEHIRELSDMNQMLKNRIVHFFEHYKDLEKGKWVKITGWADSHAALDLIEKGIARASQ